MSRLRSKTRTAYFDRPRQPPADGVAHAVDSPAGPAHRMHSARSSWDSRFLAACCCFPGIGLLAAACGVVQVFNRRVYLVGITQPLWACGVAGAERRSERSGPLRRQRAKAEQLNGMTSLHLATNRESRRLQGRVEEGALRARSEKRRRFGSHRRLRRRARRRRTA